VRRAGQYVVWRPELYRARHRLLKARERLAGRERRRLAELFKREPLIAEAWRLKESFRDIYRSGDRAEAQRRLEAFLAAVDRACLPAFDAFAKGIRIWQTELWPTSTSRRPTVTPKVSSTRSKSSNAAPTASPPSPPSASACS
jgi:hypothetical protein